MANQKTIGADWNLAIHFPYFPQYDYDFVVRLNEVLKVNNLFVLTDLRSGFGVPPSNKLDEVTIKPAKNFKFMGVWFTPALIAAAIKMPRKTVLVYCGNPRDITVLISSFLARLLGKKVVFWGMFHSIGKSSFASIIAFKLMALLGHQLFTYSRAGAIAQLARGTAPSKVCLVGTAIKAPVINQSIRKLSKAEITDMLGLSDKIAADTFVITHIMRLSKFKNSEKFLNCCVALSELKIDLVFLIVGGGEMESYIISQLEKLGLSDLCVFAGPIYDYEKLQKIYRIADISLIPTCIGLSAHQSLSYGVGVITDDSLSEQTSEFEILTHNYNALIYHENNYNHLKQCVRTVYGNSKLKAKLASNAKLSAEINSLEQKAANFKLGIENLLKLDLS
jgi:glycosyltransferase involved in cell wall biosynthesis